ncbi:MAG: hypothetical protein WBD22_02330, partial [Pyrinomonadaceae bacterium]
DGICGVEDGIVSQAPRPQVDGEDGARTKGHEAAMLSEPARLGSDCRYEARHLGPESLWLH